LPLNGIEDRSRGLSFATNCHQCSTQATPNSYQMQAERTDTQELFSPGKDFPFVGKDCYRRVLRSMADETLQAFDTNGCTFPDLPPVADENLKDRSGLVGMIVPCPGDLDDGSPSNPHLSSHSEFSDQSNVKLDRWTENSAAGDHIRHSIKEAFSEGLKSLKREHKAFLNQLDHDFRVGAARKRKLSLGSADVGSITSGEVGELISIEFNGRCSKGSQIPKTLAYSTDPSLSSLKEKEDSENGSEKRESFQELTRRRSHRHRPSYHIDLMQRRISMEIQHARRKEFIASLCSCVDRCIPHAYTHFVRGTKFNIGCSVVMLVFAGIVGVEADVKMQTALVNEPEPTWPETTSLFFNIFFAAEVLVRLLGESSSFFIGKDWRWNVFDLLLVMLSIVEMLGDGIKLSFFRVLRALKVIRVVRVVRVVRWFHELRVMLTSILASLASLCWTLLFLGVFTFLSSTAIMQGVANFLRDEVEAGRESLKLRSEVELYFPNIYTSMYTLIGSICGGEDWLIVARPLWEAGALYGTIFVGFVLVSILGILNVVTSMFVERASSLKKMDRDFAIAEEMTSMRSDIKDTLELFKVLDPEGNGTVDLVVLEEFLMEDVIVAHFATLGIDVTDQSRIAHLLDPHNDGCIGLREFVAGCIGLRGGSNKMDSMITLEMLRDLRATIDIMQEDISQIKELKESQHLPAESTARRRASTVSPNARTSIRQIDTELRSSPKPIDTEVLGREIR